MSLSPVGAQDMLLRALRREQEFAEARMRWTCRVVRPPVDGAPWIPDEDGIEQPPEPVQIYAGPFRVGSFQPEERTPDVGGATEVLNRERGHFPAVERMPALVAAGEVVCDLASMPFRSGDVVVRTVGGVDSTTYRVMAAHDTTDQTAQRPGLERGA